MIAPARRAIATPEALADFFWIMTLNWPTDFALTLNTVSGTARYPAGYSRRQAFADCEAEARRMIGLPADVRIAVLFFYLEPAGMAPGCPS